MSIRYALPAFMSLVLIAGCQGSGGEAQRLNREGNQAYTAGDYQAALDAYQRANVERPDLTEINYNAGNALHRMGQLGRAVNESQKAAATGSNDTRFRAYYALGNHFAGQDKWREAYESYRNALVLNPSDMDAKYNLEVALRRLAEQQQQRQQAQQPGQQPTPGDQQQDAQGRPGGGGDQAQPPQPGGQQQPGGQAQQPGQPSGQQPPGGQAQQPGGQQQPGQPGGGAGLAGTPPAGQGARIAAGEQDLKDAEAQFERNLSIEDALRILDILAEQQRQRQSQIPGPPPGSNIRDQ